MNVICYKCGHNFSAWIPEEEGHTYHAYCNKCGADNVVEIPTKLEIKNKKESNKTMYKFTNSELEIHVHHGVRIFNKLQKRASRIGLKLDTAPSAAQVDVGYIITDPENNKRYHLDSLEHATIFVDGYEAKWDYEVIATKAM